MFRIRSREDQVTPLTGESFDAWEYANALRTDQQGVNPPGWTVDWADAPWAVKVYSGGTRIPLRTDDEDPTNAALAQLLFDGFAISRIRFDPAGGLSPSVDGAVSHAVPRYVPRRPIASGGAMYPAEVYVVRSGVLAHYDPYRHELVDLQHPEPEEAVLSAMAATSVPKVLVVLTNRFWKNFYKYGDFAYRLGAVDLGVALGRTLRLGRDQFGPVSARCDFDDTALNTALGIDGEIESAYATVWLGEVADRWQPSQFPSRPRPPEVLERSREIKRSERFDAMHRCASVLSTWEQLPAQEHAVTMGYQLGPTREVDLTTRETLSGRTSNGRLFTGDEVATDALATVLRHSERTVAELRRDSRLGADLGLYCTVQRVAGVPSGWYSFHDGVLYPVGTGHDATAGRTLQSALFADTVNLELAAFTVHLSGSVAAKTDGFARGYREQQMAVGVVVDTVTLVATALDLGSHPFLGFDAVTLDSAYGLIDDVQGLQAQVSVGRVRADSKWEARVVAR